MRGLYIHVPFCLKKCSYCDFYSVAGRANLVPDYVKAVLIEAARYAGLDFQTLYLGGGTPSLLGPESLKTLLTGLRGIFDLSGLIEATLEANPESATLELLELARRAGINRLSLGVQSLADAELRSVGRVHNAARAVQAVNLARQCGFDNVSADVIIGLPGQHRQALLSTLDTLDKMKIQHISAYCLQLEEDTPLGKSRPMDLPSDDEQAEIYELSRDFLSGRGFIHYEISNFSRQGFECLHNLNYWRGGEYAGMGPAAASHLDGRRFRNKADLDSYLLAPGTLTEDTEELGPSEKSAEEAMLRLRLVVEGLDVRELSVKFGPDNTRELEERVRELAQSEQLIQHGSSFRLPADRVLTCNPILAAVLGG
jgi:oxygen-independent coproporphyrinogen III oxidase